MHQEKLKSIEICEFKRNHNDQWEPELLLNEGTLGILDQYGQLVEECWNWRRTHTFNLYLENLLETNT